MPRRTCSALGSRAANDTVTPVAHSTEPVTAPGIRARINRVLDQAGAVPHVDGFADPYQEPGAISADGTTIVASLRLDTADPLDLPHESVATLISIAKGAGHDGLTVAVTGVSMSTPKHRRSGPRSSGCSPPRSSCC